MLWSTLRELSVASNTTGSGAKNEIEDVAVQFSPAVLFFSDTLVGGRTYENDKLMQAFARTSLELATSKSADARVGQQFAASLNVGLIDGSDPPLFWAPLDDCARKAMRSAALLPMPLQMMTAAELSAWNLSQATAIGEAKDCYTAYLAANEKNAGMWAKPRWYAGYARAWSTGPSSKMGDSTAGPAMLWTSFQKASINRTLPPARSYNSPHPENGTCKSTILWTPPGSCPQIARISSCDCA